MAPAPAAFGTADGTVILTNFVPSDAATIGEDGFGRKEGGKRDLERERGRKSLSFQFRGRPTGASAAAQCVYDD